MLMLAPAWPAPLALEAALQLAVSQHPVISQRRSQQRAAKDMLDAAESGRWPTLGGQTGKDTYGKATLTLRVEQPLWTGGRLAGQIDAAEAGMRSASAALEESQQDILLRTVNTYTELGRLESRIAAARANVVEHARLRTMILNRIEHQITPNSDGILVSARLAQANAELSQNLVLAARARTALGQLVGERVTDITTPARPPLESPLLDPVVASAISYSPTLRRLQAQADVASAETRVRRGQALPQVMLRHDTTRGGQVPGSSTYVAIEYMTGGAGLASHALIREAEARYQSALAEIEMATRNTVETVGADWADLQSLNTQAGDLQAQVEAQGQVHESYVRLYVVGRKNWIELLNAQRELAQARYALADTQWGVLRSQLRLQLATGQLQAATLPAPTSLNSND
jgi:adhesin transport system outer membrane protein